MGNLLLKIPYESKKSYSGSPEPQTTEDAPWLHGPSIFKRGSVPRGAPSVPPFSISCPEKRLELKSLKGQTKAEEEGTPCPFFLSLRVSLKAL
jgi:hypothetical protein